MKTLPILLSSVVFPLVLTSNSLAASTDSGDTQIPIGFVRRMMNFGSQDSQLWVGSLPDQLPVELPKLPNSQVVGSRSRKDDHFDFLTIHLDTTESPKQVQAFYQAQLSTRGWTQATVQKPRNPLAAKKTSVDGEPQNALHFCNLAKDVALSVTTDSGTNSVTEVSLTLEPRKSSQLCQTQKEQDASVEEMSNQMVTQLKTKLEKLYKLAAIAAPPGSKVFPLNNGFFGDTLIRTSLDPQLLAEHYAAQMRLGGWKYQDSGKVHNLSWSTWTTVDAQGNKLIALLSFVADTKLPEINLRDERAEVSDSGAIYLASRSAALPTQKSRQYWVSLSALEVVKEEPKITSQKTSHSDAPRREPIQADDSKEISQKLAFRFLGEGFKGELFPNQLPPQLPMPFPVLPSAQLMGSWVNETREVVLFFDVAQPAQAIHQFYKGQSHALKWVDFLAASNQLSQTGFLEPKDAYQLNETGKDGLQYVFLCEPQNQVEIVLQTWEQSSTTASLRVDLRPDSSNCEQSDEESKEAAAEEAALKRSRKHIPIPLLMAPPHAEVQQSSESADKKFYTQQAGIASQSLTGEALALHYEQQMRQQGWQSEGRYATDLMYLSLWQLTDKQGNQWHSLLKLVRSHPSSDFYSADLTLLKGQE